MHLWTRVRGVIGASLAALGVALSSGGTASAQVYDFNRFLSGGGGGQDPQKKRIVSAMGAYLCLGLMPGSDPGTIRFSVWSRIPQPRSRVSAIAFDLGRHTHLLKSVSVQMTSQGVKARAVPAQAHPFLSGMSPEFWVEVASKGHLSPEGLAPGRMVVINGTLGDGVSINDLIDALHEGMQPTTGVRGFRVGVIVMYMLGGPPPGVGTIQDDGGFVVAGPGQACG